MALNTQAAPLMNLFELGVAPGKTVQYDQVAAHNIGTSIQTEKGTLAMYSVKSADTPDLAYMLEIYADEAAYQTHRLTPHFQDYLQQTADMVLEKRQVPMTPAFLGNQGGI